MKDSPAGFSIDNIERHVIETVLKARELAEICGDDVVVDIADRIHYSLFCGA